MAKLNYEQIMNIQENATKKLLNYIDKYIQNQNEIETIEFYYPDFDENRTAIAFNVWVSLDYRTKEGKNFIEHLLDEKSQSLTDLEKEILKERNKSHISLFEIIGIEKNYIYIEDLLCRKHYTVLEPELSKLVKVSDLVFGRVAKLIKFQKFIGDVNFLPNFAKDLFLENIFLDYNIVRKKQPNLSIQNYLRKYSSNVYRIYTECIYEVIDIDDDISTRLALELAEFKNHLENLSMGKSVMKHINNLVNICEFYLFEEELTLYDLNKISLEAMLEKAIFDGLIISQSQLNSYISTLKRYLNLLRKRDNIYNESYEEILRISRNRFTYLNNHDTTKLPIQKNEQIMYAFKDSLNEKSYAFLSDYNKYLVYIQIEDVKVTATKKYIKRNHLLKINKFLANEVDVSHFKAPNQINMPLLHLFYKFSISHDILTVKNEKIYPSSNFNSYLVLDEEEKLCLFVDYIWNIASWKELDPSIIVDIDERSRYDMLDALSSLEPDLDYTLEEIFSPITIDLFTDTFANLFETMGLLNITGFSEPKLSFTSLGGKVFKALKKYIEQKDDDKVIHLDEYRKNK